MGLESEVIGVGKAMVGSVVNAGEKGGCVALDMGGGDEEQEECVPNNTL